MAPGALGTFETIHTGGTDAITTGVTHIPRIAFVEGSSATLTRNPHKRYCFKLLMMVQRYEKRMRGAFDLYV